eukprot:288797-Chlamydomonas_euryale.AAC.1
MGVGARGDGAAAAAALLAPAATNFHLNLLRQAPRRRRQTCRRRSRPNRAGRCPHGRCWAPAQVPAQVPAL